MTSSFLVASRAVGRSLLACTCFAGIPSISFHRSHREDFSSVTKDAQGMETRCERNAQSTNGLSSAVFSLLMLKTFLRRDASSYA